MQARRVRALALSTGLLAVLVVMVSAYLRLAGAGLGCGDWPACYGAVLASAAPATWQGARLAHRLVATLALLAGILLVWQCWRPRPLQPAARYATLLLVLMLFLSLVGVWSADPRRVPVNFINLVGGLGLVTFSWRVALTAESSRLLERGHGGRTCRAMLATLTLTIVLGGLIGARYAAAACDTLPDCNGVWWPAAQGWQALNPFGTLAAPARPGDGGGVALHLLHRYAAAVAVLLVGVVALRLRAVRRARNAALALLLLLLVEGAIGALTVASGFSLWLAVAHNVGAALLLAAAASLMHSVRQ